MFNYILYRIGEFLSLCLPIKCGYFIARIISGCQYLFSRQDRVSVYNNLKAIFPEGQDRLLKKYTITVFVNFGKYLVEFLRFRKTDRGYIEKNIKVEGLKNIACALSGGRGLIIASVHIGNWELGAAALGVLGYSINVVALTHKQKKVDIFFNSQRESKDVRVIPLGRAVRSCLEAFNRNEIVCLVGDRDFTQGGVVVDFFGKPAMIPRGPAAFSLKNKTPIVFGVTIREGVDKFRLFFNPPIQFNPSGDYQKDLKALTRVYLKEIEDSIRKYPDQWYMFRKFWL